MQVLIIRKPTNLEQHQKLAQQGLVPERADAEYLAQINAAHREHYACYESLREHLREAGIQMLETSRGEEAPRGPFSYVLSLGGDGTLITASYGIQDETRLIGIRSSSASVGYLCAASLDNIPALVKGMKAESLPFILRHRLKAHIERENGERISSPFLALNDFLFAASSPAATTRYQISAGQRTETHKSSGVWIATATGSTAAIGAAGGAPMEAHDARFQYLVRELYRRKEDQLQLFQGFVAPERESFSLRSLCPAAILALDGDKWISPIHFGDKIHFTLGQAVRVALPPQD